MRPAAQPIEEHADRLPGMRELPPVDERAVVDPKPRRLWGDSGAALTPQIAADTSNTQRGTSGVGASSTGTSEEAAMYAANGTVPWRNGTVRSTV